MNTNDFGKVAKAQERILESYRMDIARYAKGAEKNKVKSCYDAIPRQLSKEIMKENIKKNMEAACVGFRILHW